MEWYKHNTKWNGNDDQRKIILMNYFMYYLNSHTHSHIRSYTLIKCKHNEFSGKKKKQMKHLKASSVGQPTPQMN